MTNTAPVQMDQSTSPTDARGAHVVALLLGLVAFLVIFGPRFLLVDVPFLLNPLGDVAAEMGGYFHFAQDGWRWPLFSLPEINQPEGANQVFIGGVPLLALMAKVIVTASGKVPNLFGVWYLLCFVLQTHSLFFLMRQITREQPYLLAFASILGVLSYAFLTRMGHVSLFGQFLVIYAMALLIATTRRDADPAKILTRLALLVLAGLLVFAYLAIDNIVLFGAALVSLWSRRRLSMLQAAGVGIAFAVALVSVAAAIGYFWAAGRAEPVDISSYGVLGLNLGSLVIPPQSVLFPNNSLFDRWWEGNFYLGLGIVALWALLLVSSPRAIYRIVMRNWPMALVIAVLTVYCLSNHVQFGERLLVAYALPKWMTPVVGMARSAGRLFWPIGYFLIAAAVAVTVHKYKKRAIPMVFAVVAVACAEASGTYGYVQGKIFTVPTVALNYAGLEQVMARHKRMLVYPSFWCDPGADDSPKRLTHQQLEFVGARVNVASNSAITARKMKDCRAEENSVPVVGDGDLGVFMSPAAARRSYAAAHAQDAAGQCRSFTLGAGSAVMCSTLWSQATAVPIPELVPLSSLEASLDVGQPIDFSANGNSAKYVGTGWWSVPDPRLTWTEGDVANLSFQAPNVPSSDLVLSVDATAFLHGAKLPSRSVDVFINDKQVATWTFSDSAPTERRVDLPAGLDGQAVSVSMRQSASPSPRDLGLSTDPRHLGLGVTQIVLRRR